MMDKELSSNVHPSRYPMYSIAVSALHPALCLFCPRAQVGSVDVAVTVTVPPALAVVPRPLLGMTGSLIARYAISSLLPSFLDLLATDYGRWGVGWPKDEPQ